MANHWRNEDERHDPRGSREDRTSQSGQDYRGDAGGYGRGRDDQSRSDQSRSDHGRGDQARDYGRFTDQGRTGGVGGSRSGNAGANRGGFTDYGSPSRDYGRGPYEDHGFDSERRFGSSQHDPYRAWQEDGNRGGRNDWGRQEWGMSGPQQGGYGAERGAYGNRDQGRERDYGPRHGSRQGGAEERGLWDRASDEVQSWFGDEEAERRRAQDQHRGRGPKNYARSDDRVREDASDRLTDDWQVDASEIELSVSKGEVTLTGTVSDRMQRRRAEDVVEQVSGVTHVQNNLRVRGSGPTPGTATGGAGEAASSAMTDGKRSEGALSEGTPTAITAGQSSTISSRNT